ncbi:MAG: hypothetical protein Kow0089_02950 [Desulfobulbaceae bacterium]
MKGKTQALLLLVGVLLLAGCAIPANQGRLARSGEVDVLIEAGKVLDGHAYYYTGPEAQPDAIIALEEGLTLRSKYWIRVDDPAERLRDWNRVIDNDTRYHYPYEGYEILTPEGRRVGVWYSRYDHTVVRFPDPSSIEVYTPLTPVERSRPRLNRFSVP